MKKMIYLNFVILCCGLLNTSFAKQKVMICEAQCVIVDKQLKEVHQFGTLIQTGRDRFESFAALTEQCKIQGRRMFYSFDAIIAKSVQFSESHTSETETNRESDVEQDDYSHEGDIQASHRHRRGQRQRGGTLFNRWRSDSMEGSFQAFTRRERVNSRYSRKYLATRERFYQSSSLSMDVEYASSRDKSVCDYEVVDDEWVPPLLLNGGSSPRG